MALRKKMLLAAAAITALLLVSLHLTSRLLLDRHFVQLQREDTIEDLQRLSRVLQSEIDALKTKAADYAAWDDTCAFIQKPNDAYIKSNFADATFAILHLDFALIYDSHGKLLFAKVYDPAGKTGSEAPPELVESLAAHGGLLTVSRGPGDEKKGLILLRSGPEMVASLPVLASDRSGPVRGTLVFGSRLDERVIAKISSISGLEMEIHALSGEPNSADLKEAFQNLRNQDEWTQLLGGDRIAGYGFFPDVFGARTFMLQIAEVSQITQHSRLILRQLLFSLAGLGLLFSFLGVFWVEKTLIKRIGGLAGEVDAIGASGKMEERVSAAGNDEISRLGSAINQMLADLESSQRRRREQEQKSQRILESLSEGVWIIDAQGLTTYANPRMASMLGYDVGELIGKDFRLFCDDKGGKEGTRNLGRRRSKVSEEHDYDFIRKDGARVSTRVSTSPLLDREGRYIGAIAAVSDITERKYMEDALRESEERYRAIVEDQTEMIARYRPDGTLTYVNSAYCRLWERAVENLVGKRIQDLIPHEDERSRFEKHLERLPSLRAEDAPVTREIKVRNLRGEERWFEWTDRPLFDAKGRLSEIQTVGRDTTARKTAEEQLVRLSAAVEQAVETIVITDADANIQYVNPAFERITGYSFEEARGQNPRVLKSGVQGPEFYDKMWKILTSGGVWTGHFVNRRKDGSLYEEDASISPIRDPDGTILGYVAVKRDVTRQVELEAQLQQAQKMEAIGQLAGGIAHDFNNVLASMLGYARLALDAVPEGNDARDDLQQILKAGGRARELVGQLLAFGKRSAGAVKKSPHQLGPVVMETVKLLRPALPSNVEIVINIRDRLPDVVVEPMGVHQVLMNLCINAAQAMPLGGRISIDLERVTVKEGDPRLFVGAPLEGRLNPGEYLVLGVEDTGSGIDKSILARIFEPFFTTKKQGIGSGMGLAVVYGIVKSHGGGIRVYSEPGVRTNFKIYWPVGEVSGTGVEEKTDPIRGGDESILVVDDEEPLVKMIGRILGKLGYRVEVRTDPGQVVEELQRDASKFDLVVTDQTMPGMTGDRLVEEIHRLRPGLPVILCTGFSNILTPDRMRQIHVDGLLHKPMHEGELEREVRRVLDRVRKGGGRAKK